MRSAAFANRILRPWARAEVGSRRTQVSMRARRAHAEARACPTRPARGGTRGSARAPRALACYASRAPADVLGGAHAQMLPNAQRARLTLRAGEARLPRRFRGCPPAPRVAPLAQ